MFFKDRGLEYNSKARYQVRILFVYGSCVCRRDEQVIKLKLEPLSSLLVIDADRLHGLTTLPLWSWVGGRS